MRCHRRAADSFGGGGLWPVGFEVLFSLSLISLFLRPQRLLSLFLVSLRHLMWEGEVGNC